MQNNQNTAGSQDVSLRQIIALFKGGKDIEATVKMVLYLVGILLTPLSLIGALWGFRRSYEQNLEGKGEYPELARLKPITKIAMVLGAIAIWVALIIIMWVVATVFDKFFGRHLASSYMPVIIIGVNFIFTLIAFRSFRRWQDGKYAHIKAKSLIGSARWARTDELTDLERAEGIYIGGLIYAYKKMGHFLTVAGARSGKFTNLICQNLLGMSGYSGSFFLIDIKSEIEEVTSRRQLELGREVLILDPWNLSKSKIKKASFNPLDIVLKQTNPDHFTDDIAVIAEMLVPKNKDEKDAFFTNRSRALISGLLMHLVISDEKDKTLNKLWQWLRLPSEEWDELLSFMAVSENAIVRASANEAISLMQNSSKTFASILSSAHDFTDFLKSPALQKSLMKSSFDMNKLSKGKQTLYVIIPADKLDSHSQWLRLVFATSLKAVIRNKGKRVTYILDEFAALGYLPLVKTALSTFAGYNVSIWPIVQDLSQLKSIYGDAWETFIGNTVVRHFFGIADNFTSEYVSKMIGTTTEVTYETVNGVSKPVSTARQLLTQDEVRRSSGDYIFTFIEQRPPVYFPKMPYYEMPQLKGMYEDNSYYPKDGKYDLPTNQRIASTVLPDEDDEIEDDENILRD